LVDNSIKNGTRIVSTQLEASGEAILITRGFILTDVIISNHSLGKVTLMARDLDGNTSIVVVVGKDSVFSHCFEGNWMFWKGADLMVVKESDTGLVDVSVGYIPGTPVGRDMWLR
jgi:hypothetical protein